MGADDYIRAHSHRRQCFGTDRFEATTDRVSHDRRSYLLAHDETKARRTIFTRLGDIRHSVCASTSNTASDDCFIVGSAGDAMRSREHREFYAESSTRPFARRAERIARPARVRIRARKPCFLARRRLLGWNVRLLMRITPDRRSPERSRPGTRVQGTAREGISQPTKATSRTTRTQTSDHSGRAEGKLSTDCG